MSDKDFFENDPTLKSVINAGKEDKKVKDEALYAELMAKPLMTGHDILRFPAEPNDYLIENFLWKGSIGLIIGQEKSCKSILTSMKGMAMTSGEPFLGCFGVIHPLNVLYVQAEGDMGETKERFISSTQEGGVKWNPDRWRHYFPSSLALDTDEGRDEFIKRIELDGFKPDVIIIDPLYMAMQGDLIDNKAARSFCRNLRVIKEKFKCAIIVVHHEHAIKRDQFGGRMEEGDNSIFGSSMWKNFASHVIRISIVDEKGRPISPEREIEDEKYRKVVCATQRNGNVIKEILLKLNEDPLILEIVDHPKESVIAESILSVLRNKGESYAAEIKNITGILSKNTVSKALRRMEKKNIVKQTKVIGKKTYFKVAE